MLIAANQIILNTYVCVPLCACNVFWWTFTIIHIAESFMMSPKQNMDSNVFLVIGIRTLEIMWACLQNCGVFEGGLTVPSKVKSELLRIFYFTTAGCLSKKKRKTEAMCWNRRLFLLWRRSLVSLFYSRSSRATESTCCHMMSRATPPLTSALIWSSTASSAPQTNTESSCSSSNGNFLLGLCAWLGAWLGVGKSHLFIYIWSCNMLTTMSRLGSGRFTGALLQTYSQKMKLISWAFESAHCCLFCFVFQTCSVMTGAAACLQLHNTNHWLQAVQISEELTKCSGGELITQLFQSACQAGNCRLDLRKWALAWTGSFVYIRKNIRFPNM